MKIIQLLTFIVLVNNSSIAQNSIVGKWKPIKLSASNMVDMPLEEAKLRDYTYNKTIEEKKGEPLTQEDSTGVENLIIDIISQFEGMTLDFKANKTFITTFEGKTTTGKYIYNIGTKKLTTMPKGKPSKTAIAIFENGLLKMTNTTDKVILYLEKII
jgi:hypothetical protein